MSRAFKFKLVDTKTLEPRGVELTFDRQCINGDAEPMKVNTYMTTKEATSFNIGESYDGATIFPGSQLTA